MAQQSADNVEVTHQSGLSRLGNSLCCAICGAPAALLAASFLLGYNEKLSVCQARAISAGEEQVHEVGCEYSGHNSLVMFSCDMKREGLQLSSAWTGYDRISSLLPLEYEGTGLQIKVEMYQCVEHTHQTKEKDVAGGGEKTITEYTYSKQWSEASIDSAGFKKMLSGNFAQHCGVPNPVWPAHIPHSTTVYAPEVQVGAFTVEGSMVQQIPLDAPVHLSHLEGWTHEASEPGVFMRYPGELKFPTVPHMNLQHNFGQDIDAPSGVHISVHPEQGGMLDVSMDPQHVRHGPQPSMLSMSEPEVGTMRLTLTGTNWKHKELTVLGHDHAGIIRAWEAPSAWLCSGFTLASVRRGVYDKLELFDLLQDEVDSLTWILRLTGFVLMWVGFAALAGPLGVLADCLPLIGPYLGDAVDAVACCASCVPATACTLLVAGVVWVVMRPMVGGPMLLASGGLIGALAYAKAAKKGGKATGEETTPLAES